MKTQNTISFSEIFRFAEKFYGLSWNECNDYLFGEYLNYGSYNVYLMGDFEDHMINKDIVPWDEEKESMLEGFNPSKEEFEKHKFNGGGYIILYAFFLENNIVEAVILNN